MKRLTDSRSKMVSLNGLFLQLLLRTYLVLPIIPLNENKILTLPTSEFIVFCQITPIRSKISEQSVSSYCSKKRPLEFLQCTAETSGLATNHKCIKDLTDFGYIQYQPSFNPAIGSKVVLLKV